MAEANRGGAPAAPPMGMPRVNANSAAAIRQRETDRLAALYLTEFRGRRPAAVRDPIQPTSFATPTAVEEYGFYWWFNYFWAEGRRGGLAAATEADRDKFMWVVAQMFDSASVPATESEAARINETAVGMKLTRHAEGFDSSKRRKILRTLMDVGFEEFPITHRETAQSLFAHLVTMPAREGANDHVTFSLALGYRSDSRPWAAIQAQGIRARSHVPVLVHSMNMDAPWHPFSEDGAANKLWFRRGVADNCLHSVISVASTFNDALYFPRLDDGSIYGFQGALKDRRPLNVRWTAEVNQTAKKARAGICRVVTTANEERYLVGTRTTILVFAFPPNFTAANTERYQRELKADNPFPERGVGEIDPDYVLAIVDVVRVHHGPTSDDGQTSFIQGVRQIKADDAALKSVLLTDDAVMAFKTYIGGLQGKVNQPHEYPKVRVGGAAVRLINDDAYNAAFRNGMGGTM